MKTKDIKRFIYFLVGDLYKIEDGKRKYVEMTTLVAYENEKTAVRYMNYINGADNRLNDLEEEHLTLYKRRLTDSEIEHLKSFGKEVDQKVLCSLYNEHNCGLFMQASIKRKLPKSLEN